MERAAYRVRQFFRALIAPLKVRGLEDARAELTQSQWKLFLRMGPADRDHALTVYRELRTRGHQHPDLLVGALLHDVGKAGAPLPPWTRAIVVLLQWLAPQTLERLSQGGQGRHRPLAAYRRHAELGAEWAAQAGCSPLTVAIIRRHHEKIDQTENEEEQFIVLLQEIDRNS